GKVDTKKWSQEWSIIKEADLVVYKMNSSSSKYENC
ncbi:ribokinase, partial [Streptococcus agalactiae 18RS21]